MVRTPKVVFTSITDVLAGGLAPIQLLVTMVECSAVDRMSDLQEGSGAQDIAPAFEEGAAPPTDEQEGELEDAAASDASGEAFMFGHEEDALYDADLDAANETWVKEQIRQGLAETDAVLSCPACFSTVCFLCQKHEHCSSQYRAIFIHNCVVLKDREVAPRDDTPLALHEIYNPVVCRECMTEVGVRDQEEITHFHHVLPNIA